MAITHAEVQITWPTAADSKSVTNGTSETSEEMNPDTTAIDGMITLKADNDGTPAAGDEVLFEVSYTGGDPDGASTDEFDTAAHLKFLARLDTNAEDPAIKTVPINLAAKGLKIVATNDAATNEITVSATITEVRG